jgi:hypothetical protein
MKTQNIRPELNAGKRNRSFGAEQYPIRDYSSKNTKDLFINIKRLGN